jgi:hypothetical protein
LGRGAKHQEKGDQQGSLQVNSFHTLIGFTHMVQTSG